METLPALSSVVGQLPAHQALVDLARSDFEDVTHAFRSITEQAARILDVERVSVWLFDEKRAGIVCHDLFVRSRSRHEGGVRLAATDYPRYFAALESNRAIAARDACTDPRTSEFAVGYLDVNGITSMLDAPVRADGKVLGVLCCEHVGARREWSTIEQDFAGSLADQAALAIERTERKRIERRWRLLFDRWRLLFQNSVAATYLARRDGTLLDCNDAFLRLAGVRSVDDVVGHSVADFFPDAAQRHAIGSASGPGVAATLAHASFRRHDGKAIETRWSRCILPDEDGVELGTVGETVPR